MIWVFLMFVFAAVTQAQTNSELRVSQYSGNCSVNITGNGNSASLVCKDIDPKMATQVQAILNTAYRSEKAIREVAKKLETIRAEMGRESISISQQSSGSNSPNTVTINQRPPRRHIPQNLRKSITALLAQAPTEVEILAISGHAEAGEFARDWFDVFTAAGWTVTNARVGSFVVSGPAGRGVLLHFHGDPVAPNEVFHVPRDSPPGKIAGSLEALGIMDQVHAERSLALPANRIVMQVFEHPEN